MIRPRGRSDAGDEPPVTRNRQDAATNAALTVSCPTSAAMSDHMYPCVFFELELAAMRSFRTSLRHVAGAALIAAAVGGLALAPSAAQAQHRDWHGGGGGWHGGGGGWHGGGGGWHGGGGWGGGWRGGGGWGWHGGVWGCCWSGGVFIGLPPVYVPPPVYYPPPPAYYPGYYYPPPYSQYGY